jgi:CheY-like chemotaxis protein/ketosteroid isomerase-like protein
MLQVHMARLFVCDDDATYRALLRVVLTEGGEHVVVGEAREGHECIDRAPQVCPDVILLDLNMPGMSGVEALPVLRELLPDTKIVALTTAAASDKEEEFVDLGGVAFIEKPHDIFTLRDALRRVLDAASEPRLDLVAEMFRLWSAGERDRAFGFLAADAELRPLMLDRAARGIDEIRALVASAPDDVKRATIAADRLLLAGEEVVLLATAAVPRRTEDGGEYTERFPVGWVMRVQAGKVTSVRAFGTWEEAKEAAGIGKGAGPNLERKLARSAWRWVVAWQPGLSPVSPAFPT